MKRFLGLLALLILATTPGVASAHQGNADYRSEINSIRPASLAEGLSFSIVNFDDHVRLENDSGREVVVLGYDDEPYIRISADGLVEVNLNSPAQYLNQDRFADVDLPARADENAAPEWKEVGDNGIYEWHDHRSHYMSESLPPQVKDESKETKVFDYEIPIEVDGKSATVDGTLTWVGNDSKAPVIPFVILALAVIAAIWFAVRRRRGGSDDGDEASASDPEEVDDGETEKDSPKEAW
jgi:hypothetical protein